MTTIEKLSLMANALVFAHRKQDLLEAVSELSALQKENAELRKETPTADAIIWRRACNLATDELETLRTQNRELREALTGISEYCGGNICYNEMSWCHVKGIADKALALQPEK